jgi:hypothetical protein
MSHLSMSTVRTITSMWGQRGYIQILHREGNANVRPSGLGDGAFDSYMIYFSVIRIVL